MKVFISWSGVLSQEIAEALRHWLPATLQAVRPYFSPSDIEKGARWLSEVSSELEASSVAILCLTPESLESPWILFEAGALSKSVESARICPILFGLTLSDLPAPLAQFQAAVFSRDEMLQVLRAINASVTDGALTERVLDAVFEKWWPDLEVKVKAAIQRHSSSPRGPARTDREVLGELLELARLQARQSAAAPTVRLAPKARMEMFTRGTLPSPGAVPGQLAMVVDATQGTALCFSDGYSWKAVEASVIDA